MMIMLMLIKMLMFVVQVVLERCPINRTLVMACCHCKQKVFSTTSRQYATMCSAQCGRWYEDGTEDGAWCIESCQYGSGHQGNHSFPCNHTLPPLRPDRPPPPDSDRAEAFTDKSIQAEVLAYTGWHDMIQYDGLQDLRYCRALPRNEFALSRRFYLVLVQPKPNFTKGSYTHATLGNS